MFRQSINSTALTSDAANSYFEHIIGDSFHGDVTFLSTLRALIAPRMSDNESLLLRFTYPSYSKETVEANRPKDVVAAICSGLDFYANGQVYICGMSSQKQEDNIACLDVLKSNFARLHTGWTRLSRVTDLFRTQFYTLCFANPELKSVIVFVEGLSISKMHYLQCAILGFFPWYFNPEQGVSQEEMNLINSLRGKDPGVYSECIAKLAEKYDFRSARIKQMLAGFETRFERAECEQVRSNIVGYINQIHRLQREISAYLERKNESEIRLLGLETKIAEGGEGSEIMDYFIHNHKLDLTYADDRDIEFIVRDYIVYFDEDTAKRVIDNQHSYVYGQESNYSDEKIKKLMYAIFIDQVIKIKVCAAYKFRLNSDVEALQDFDFGLEYTGYLPNPHIQGYGCMGNYYRAISEAVQRNDYITALEQSIASAKSLNFTDSTVMSRFMRELLRGNDKWLELPDGSVVSTASAVNWILEQVVHKNESNN